MRYTITALSPSTQTIEVMRRSLLAVGAPRDAIFVDPGSPGTSQPQISVKTDNLDASESYREALELAGGLNVTANEESSVLNAVTPSDQQRAQHSKSDTTTAKPPPAKIWQERGKWLVQMNAMATVISFATREEAIAYSTSAYTDGASAARAETQRGDVAMGDATYKKKQA